MDRNVARLCQDLKTAEGAIFQVQATAAQPPVPTAKTERANQPAAAAVTKNIQGTTHYVTTATTETKICPIQMPQASKPNPTRSPETSQAGEAREDGVQASIIQYLVADSPDLAAELFQRSAQLLTPKSRSEISVYVHHLIDREVIDFLFPEVESTRRV